MPYDKFDQCTRPDRDEPKLVCGYPRPCPHHTVAITEHATIIPKAIKLDAEGLRRIHNLRKALK